MNETEQRVTFWSGMTGAFLMALFMYTKSWETVFAGIGGCRALRSLGAVVTVVTRLTWKKTEEISTALGWMLYQPESKAVPHDELFWA